LGSGTPQKDKPKVAKLKQFQKSDMLSVAEPSFNSAFSHHQLSAISGMTNNFAL
jgi:hypothetical protein